ncbi:MAG: penicillin-binding protein 2 [Gammaproteobacteria bacterium]|nr:penicillin-binding protein 2 [Gammaproteobacteria bacterium]
MAHLDSLSLRDPLKESLLFNKRLMFMIGFISLLTLILLGRLFQLQVLNNAHYSTLSEKNRVNILPIAPTRGLIYDRNGVLIAHNIPSFYINIIPERVENMDETLALLKQLITLTPRELKRFKRQLRRKRKFVSIPLRYRLNEAEVARVSVNQYRLPGVQIKSELLRHYPVGELMAHVAGYVGRISEKDLRVLNTREYSASSHIGKVGIEKFYENILHGSIGHQRVETNAQGRIIKVLERTLPTPGKTLYLNVDSNLQSVAYKAFGDNNGALMAIDPVTGAVLAMVSAPSYDPNVFVHGLEADDYQKITKSPRRPLFNRALQGQYPPGSTLKPLLGLAGLELDEVYAHNPIDCKGWYMLEDDVDERRYRDWKRSGHGATNLIDAIAESCDIYFYDLSYNLGIDRIHQYLSAFGMGKMTGIDMEGELTGIVPNKEWKRIHYNEMWFPGETLINGIGQGFMLATPVQLVSFTAALTQGGKRYKPAILKAMQDPKSKVLETIEPVALEAVHQIRMNNWEVILRSMHKVVHGFKGSARGISQGIKYKMAGKTGTSQVFGIKQGERYRQDKLSKKLHDHALFVGFAPYKNPRIAVSAIVENGGGGGSVAAPIVRKVIDQYLLGKVDEPQPTE